MFTTKLEQNKTHILFKFPPNKEVKNSKCENDLKNFRLNLYVFQTIYLGQNVKELIQNNFILI